MRRKLAAVLTAAAIALACTGCSSEFDKHCTARGGESKRRVIGYIPVTVGKVVTIQPMWGRYCLLPDGSEERP